MKRAVHFLMLPAALVMLSAWAVAQTPARDSTASISGRVTVGGKAAAGITVTATTGSPPLDIRTAAKTTTDDDGNYRLTGLAAGPFTIIPIARAYVVATGGRYKAPGQPVNVAEGESITKIDFELVRGGVITGRITDAEDRPVIRERVNVVPQNNQSAGRQASIFDGAGNLTDDRGVYRVYGLAPGSYKVSAGQPASGDDSVNILGMGGSRYVRTFYPGVREETKATTIEINEGSEVTGVDIALGNAAPGFSLSGRVIDAESEQPVPNAFIAYSSINEANQQLGGMNFSASQTDASGKFRLEGVKPGRYAVFTLGVGQDNTSYSDPVPFEISEGDVTGVEIKVRRGATVSGVAVIENNLDPAASASLQTVSLSAFVQAKGIATPSFSSAKIKPDGSFHFAGLGPGKVQIAIQSFPVPPKGLTLARTEINGLDQPDGIELTPGARITGARLVFAYGTGAIRGEVKIEGGVLPAGTTLRLLLRSGAGDTRRFSRPVGIDARGRFVAENIPPGTYELVLRPVAADGRAAQAFEPVTQAVTVANAMEVQATLVVNLAAGKAGPE